MVEELRKENNQLTQSSAMTTAIRGREVLKTGGNTNKVVVHFK